MLQLSLIRNEQMKIFSRFRSWTFILLILAATLIPVLLETRTSDGVNWQTRLEQENAELKNAIDSLGPSERGSQELQEKIIVNEYRLVHGFKPYNSPWATVNELSVLISLVTLLTVITTADAVAGEFSGGTIKMLLTRPVSWSQILLSKYLSSFLFGIILLAVLFLASLTIGIVWHGFTGLTDPYLYVLDGTVEESSMLLHSVQLYALKSVSLLMIVTLAFMISTVFRGVNTAVVISMLFLLTKDLLVFTLKDYEWIKYVFFTHTDLSKYLNGGVTVPGVNFLFSIIVLAVYFVLFNAISWTVFTKREVAAN